MTLTLSAPLATVGEARAALRAAASLLPDVVVASFPRACCSGCSVVTPAVEARIEAAGGRFLLRRQFDTSTNSPRPMQGRPSRPFDTAEWLCWSAGEDATDADVEAFLDSVCTALKSVGFYVLRPDSPHRGIGVAASPLSSE